MFNVGDIIVRKDGKKERLIVVEVRYAVLVVETVTDNREELSQYMINAGDKLDEYWKIDEIYYRRKKLQKICSKLEI